MGNRLRRYKREDLPEPGSVFIAPLKDGRLTAGRILRLGREDSATTAIVAGSSWIGASAPSLDTPSLRETLQLNHHDWGNRRWGNSLSLVGCFGLMPAEYTIIGKLDLAHADRTQKCDSYANWDWITIQALSQWRWDHDRDNLLREEAEEAAREQEARKLEAERRAEFMRTLTLDLLAQRDWLESWDDSLATTSQARHLLEGLVRDLRALPKPTLAAVRKLVQVCVQEFNRLDGNSQFIDTLEREDLYEAFEQILCAARQSSLVDQIDNWRKW